MSDEAAKNKRRTSSGWVLPPECCQWDSCTQQAEYPAPVSPGKDDEYIWFCLEHVRTYNQQWNYYRHATPRDIEQHYRSCTTNNRPTWSRIDYLDMLNRLSEQASHWQWQPTQDSPMASASIPTEIQQALAIMQLSYPTTCHQIKMQYKQLAKRYHPDINSHPNAHQQFTRLCDAYHTLLHHPLLQDNPL